VSDHARSKGAKLIVWYEPEHVWPGSKLYEHQDWLLSAPNDPRVRAEINQGLPLGNRRLLNLGHPAACEWAINHFSQLVEKEGIAVYRQDFNLEPLVFWRHTDLPDRQGMTENLYVMGYLRFWQTLLERHPQLLIDSCASGGRRNDLETLRLSVPLWRSDTAGPAASLQCQTYGLALWIPYFGTGTPGIFGGATPGVTVYDYRSSLGASLVSGYDVRKRDLDYNLLRKLEGDFWLTAPFFLEDYYPLTPYSQAKDQWIAWQFDRPKQGDGMVQAFRREQCEAGTQTYRLRGLEPAAAYELTNFDLAGTTVMSGKDLMDKGLTVEIKDKPGAAIISYRRVKPQK
jgi:alpha-galactosidase